MTHGNYETDLVFDKPAGLQSVAVQPVGLRSSVAMGAIPNRMGDFETHKIIN